MGSDGPSLGVYAFAMTWMAGIALANGFWSTVAAIFFLPWGWYLVAERLISYI